jgi:hypothetical protein
MIAFLPVSSWLGNMVLDLSYKDLEFGGMVTAFGSEFLILNFAGSNADLPVYHV